jgi:hypothetical protein
VCAPEKFWKFCRKTKIFFILWESNRGLYIVQHTVHSAQCTNCSYTDGTIVLQNWAEHVTCMGQQKYIQSLAENLSKLPPPPGTEVTSGPGSPHHTPRHDHVHLDIRHLVGVLWTDGQPDADTSTRQNKTVTRQTSMPRRGSNSQSRQASSRRPMP